MSLYFLLPLLLSYSAVPATADTCRALALEGGGSHGAYQAGVLIGLIDGLDPAEVQWNVVTGISAGSLNAGAVSQYAMGDEANMKTFINETWSTLKGFSSVMKLWPLGPIDSVFFKSGLFDSSPLKQTLTEKFHGQIKRNITVGTTSLDYGYMGYFNESIGPTNMVEACLSSSSIQAVFPMQYFQGQYWMDGGAKMDLDTFTAIERCLDVSPQNEVILDVVFCSAATLDVGAYNYTTTNVIYRQQQIQSYDSSRWMIYYAQLAYPNVTGRSMVQPTVSLKGITSIDFRPKIMLENLAIGYADGLKAVSTNPDPIPTIQSWRSALNQARPYQRTSSK